MGGKFLDKTYKTATPDETRAHYDAWAESYDAEITANGYVTPDRVAAALWAQLPEPQVSVLDFGCGTGLSGVALRKVGLAVIDGMDPSPAMLDQARAKDVYRHLTQLDPAAKAPVARGAYRAITASGVIGLGAAPPRTFDMLMHALDRGGLFAFSLNDHALGDPAYLGRLNEWLDCGAARLLSRDYGTHLPGVDLKSNVYVVAKA